MAIIEVGGSAVGIEAGVNSLGARAASRGVFDTGLPLLTARTHWPLSNQSGQASTSYRMKFYMPNGARNVRFVFYNGYGTNGTYTENLSVSPVTFGFAAEYPQGAVIPGSALGTKMPTVQPGQFLVTDPIDVDVPPGSPFWVRTFVVQSGSTVWPLISSGIFSSGNSNQDGDCICPRVVGASNASPIVITCDGAHNLSTGDSVTISGTLGNTAANGTWTVTRTSGNTFSLDGSTGNGTFAGSCFVYGADMTLAGSGKMNGVFNSLGMFMPVAIIGDTYNGEIPGWSAILLDSIARGSGETSAPFEGFIERGLGGWLAASVPYVNIAIPGLTSGQFADATNRGAQSSGRRRLALSAPYIFNQGGTNDLASATWQAIAGYNLSIASDAAARKSKVVQSTILPKTTSSDSWATATNQTVTAQETKRIDYNTWLRGGAPIVDGVAVVVGTSGALLAGSDGHPFWRIIDPCALIEVNASNVLTQNGGRWLTNGSANYPTTDGTHPTAAFHTILSDSVAAVVPFMTDTAVALP